jgi:hypothetical protein
MITQVTTLVNDGIGNTSKTMLYPIHDPDGFLFFVRPDKIYGSVSGQMLIDLYYKKRRSTCKKKQ